MLVKIKHILIIKSILLSLNQCSTNAHQKNDNKIKILIQALTFSGRYPVCQRFEGRLRFRRPLHLRRRSLRNGR